jgi:hypothetical protein
VRSLPLNEACHTWVELEQAQDNRGMVRCAVAADLRECLARVSSGISAESAGFSDYMVDIAAGSVKCGCQASSSLWLEESRFAVSER